MKAFPIRAVILAALERSARLPSVRRNVVRATPKDRNLFEQQSMPHVQTLLLAVLFPLVSLCDVPARQSAQKPNSAVGQQSSQLEKEYRRCIQFAEGDGVPQNYTLAAQCYRHIAEQGHADAQYDLAQLYAKGIGVGRDLKMAAYWYRRAALQGDVEAQNNLGVLYATGQGVRRNDAAAVYWYGLAVEKNDPEATSNLGMMYLEGRGVRLDFAKAFQLFGKAAEQGNAIAQNNLALMYANGQAVVRDYVSEYAWFDVAAQEISGCSELRDRVAEEMTGEEVGRARELANRKREQLAQRVKASKR